MKSTERTNVNQAKLAHSIGEAARLTGLSENYLRRCAGRELKVTRFGRRILILNSSLADFLNKGVDGGGRPCPKPGNEVR